MAWKENKKWLRDRFERGDDFGMATDPATLPTVDLVTGESTCYNFGCDEEGE